MAEHGKMVIREYGLWYATADATFSGISTDDRRMYTNVLVSYDQWLSGLLSQRKTLWCTCSVSPGPSTLKMLASNHPSHKSCSTNLVLGRGIISSRNTWKVCLSYLLDAYPSDSDGHRNNGRLLGYDISPILCQHVTQTRMYPADKVEEAYAFIAQ